MFQHLCSVDFRFIQVTLIIAVCTVALALPASAVDVFAEGFEGTWPGWTQEKDSNNLSWVKAVMDNHNGSAHGGSYFALLYSTFRGSTTTLVTPPLNLTAHVLPATLEFWHRQMNWSGDQDTLKVYYKTASGGSWNLLATYLSDTPAWTKRTISLPEATSTYYIGFMGTANYGYGLCIDDVRVYDDTPERPPVAVRISDLARSPLPPNPVRVWGVVTSVSPLAISDGVSQIAVSGVTALTDDFVIVTGNWSGNVLTATEPAQVYTPGSK